jgi:hypothetical protein
MMLARRCGDKSMMLSGSLPTRRLLGHVTDLAFPPRERLVAALLHGVELWKVWIAGDNKH